eukprot:GHVN01059261.1.p1 GENE.GHVN01059261.1~~GHVN01059261.1.p1  ORF type:complete len:1505 (+),score=211.46 GHVN01059261.1:927-5441(+)
MNLCSLDKALDELNTILNLGNLAGAGKNRAGLKLPHYPALFWVLRDFDSSLPAGPDGHPISPNQYLEQSLRPSACGTALSSSYLAQAKKNIRDGFRVRDCMVMPRPTLDEESGKNVSRLNSSDLQPLFLKAVSKFTSEAVRLLRDSRRPDHSFMNGRKLALLLRGFVNEINRVYDTQSLPTQSWGAVNRLSVSNEEECMRAYVKKMSVQLEAQPLPWSEGDVFVAHFAAVRQSFSRKLETDAAGALNERLASLLFKNSKESKQTAEESIKRQYEHLIAPKLNHDCYGASGVLDGKGPPSFVSALHEMLHDWHQILDTTMSQCKGPSLANVICDAVQYRLVPGVAQLHTRTKKGLTATQNEVPELELKIAHLEGRLRSLDKEAYKQQQELGQKFVGARRKEVEAQFERTKVLMEARLEKEQLQQKFRSAKADWKSMSSKWYRQLAGIEVLLAQADECAAKGVTADGSAPSAADLGGPPSRDEATKGKPQETQPRSSSLFSFKRLFNKSGTPRSASTDVHHREKDLAVLKEALAGALSEIKSLRQQSHPTDMDFTKLTEISGQDQLENTQARLAEIVEEVRTHSEAKHALVEDDYQSLALRFSEERENLCERIENLEQQLSKATKDAHHNKCGLEQARQLYAARSEQRDALIRQSEMLLALLNSRKNGTRHGDSQHNGSGSQRPNSAQIRTFLRAVRNPKDPFYSTTPDFGRPILKSDCVAVSPNGGRSIETRRPCRKRSSSCQQGPLSPSLLRTERAPPPYNSSDSRFSDALPVDADVGIQPTSPCSERSTTMESRNKWSTLKSKSDSLSTERLVPPVSQRTSFQGSDLRDQAAVTRQEGNEANSSPTSRSLSAAEGQTQLPPRQLEAPVLLSQTQVKQPIGSSPKEASRRSSPQSLKKAASSRSWSDRGSTHKLVKETQQHSQSREASKHSYSKNTFNTPMNERTKSDGAHSFSSQGLLQSSHSPQSAKGSSNPSSGGDSATKRLASVGKLTSVESVHAESVAQSDSTRSAIVSQSSTNIVSVAYESPKAASRLPPITLLSRSVGETETCRPLSSAQAGGTSCSKPGAPSAQSRGDRDREEISSSCHQLAAAAPTSPIREKQRTRLAPKAPSNLQETSPLAFPTSLSGAVPSSLQSRKSPNAVEGAPQVPRQQRCEQDSSRPPTSSNEPPPNQPLSDPSSAGGSCKTKPLLPIRMSGSVQADEQVWPKDFPSEPMGSVSSSGEKSKVPTVSSGASSLVSAQFTSTGGTSRLPLLATPISTNISTMSSKNVSESSATSPSVADGESEREREARLSATPPPSDEVTGLPSHSCVESKRLPIHSSQLEDHSPHSTPSARSDCESVVTSRLHGTPTAAISVSFEHLSTTNENWWWKVSSVPRNEVEKPSAFTHPDSLASLESPLKTHAEARKKGTNIESSLGNMSTMADSLSVTLTQLDIGIQSLPLSEAFTSTTEDQGLHTILAEESDWGIDSPQGSAALQSSCSICSDDSWGLSDVLSNGSQQSLE